MIVEGIPTVLTPLTVILTPTPITVLITPFVTSTYTTSAHEIHLSVIVSPTLSSINTCTIAESSNRTKILSSVMISPQTDTMCYILSLAIVLYVSITGINNFQIFASPQAGNVKTLTLTLLVSDTNGTEVLRIPLNASVPGNATSIGPMMDVIIKDQNGESLVSAFQVQTGCEMGARKCVLK